MAAVAAAAVAACGSPLRIGRSVLGWSGAVLALGLFLGAAPGPDRRGAARCLAADTPLGRATLPEVKRLLIDDTAASQARRDSLRIPTLDSARVQVVATDSLCRQAAGLVARLFPTLPQSDALLLLDLGGLAWWATEHTADPGHPNHLLLDRGLTGARLIQHPFDP